MARTHLFEIEDQPWLPNFLREAVTGFLLVSHKLAGLNKVFLPKLEEVIKQTGATHIVDLGSGAGGPTPLLLKDLRTKGYDISITLTDLYPNKSAIEKFKDVDGINYYPHSVDATNVPNELKGIRTMIASFHHLRPEVAKSVLKNAQDSGEPIIILEPFGRNLIGFISLLPSPIMAFLLVPFIRPFRLSYLLFTYVIPLIPFIVFFDGWVSWLRIYQSKDIKRIFDSLEKSDKYEWQEGLINRTIAPFIIGKKGSI